MVVLVTGSKRILGSYLSLAIDLDFSENASKGVGGAHVGNLDDLARLVFDIKHGLPLQTSVVLGFQQDDGILNRPQKEALRPAAIP
jgi:hypothetical protein